MRFCLSPFLKAMASFMPIAKAVMSDDVWSRCTAGAHFSGVWVRPVHEGEVSAFAAFAKVVAVEWMYLPRAYKLRLVSDLRASWLRTLARDGFRNFSARWSVGSPKAAASRAHILRTRLGCQRMAGL